MNRNPSFTVGAACCGLALAFVSGGHSVFAQGSLTPPGAPGPTMKSLDQIEARTAITNTASLVTISQPGSYYLTHNITVSTGDGIDIVSSGVTLDLNGFTIHSTAASATGIGILLDGNLANITIANGFIRGGLTGTSSGFVNGIEGISDNGASANVLVSRISVSGCLSSGINLISFNSTVVEFCTVQMVGYGISASSVKSCSVLDCEDTAIYGDQVSDCRGESSGIGYGITATSVQNCHGVSVAYYGITATTAQNCYGVSSSGNGITATVALNCYGVSTSGYGLYATTASNCYGTTSGNSGFGLRATTAQNCYGYNGGGGTGLYGEELAIGCFGYAKSGTGLSAGIANSCHGTTTSGSPEAITHRYNMP